MQATETRTELTLRSATQEDAAELGRICYEAFYKISTEHNFPPDFPSVEIPTGLVQMMIDRPDVYSVVAEQGGRILGSNFLWESDAIVGVGPVTVDPSEQNSSVGKALMQDVIRRADERGAPAVRLVQAAFHNRSLSLYTKLGFDTVEPLSVMQGSPSKVTIEGYEVRKMTVADLDAVDAVAKRVHGHTRRNEVASAIEQGTAVVVEHDGRITGYSTIVGFFGHTVGESNEELKAMIAASESIAGPGFLLPTRNSELMRWCFENGLRVVQPMTLMSRGIYQEPRGAFLPSILY